MSCGRVMGMGESCVDGWECGQCQEIKKLKAFVGSVADCEDIIDTMEGPVPVGLVDIIEQAIYIRSLDEKMPKEQFERIVSLGDEMTAPEAIQRKEDMAIFYEIDKILKSATDVLRSREQ